LPRLLDKGLIRTVGMEARAKAAFTWTELGWTLTANLDRLLPTFAAEKKAKDGAGDSI
jgi:hypothetical protein